MALTIAHPAISLPLKRFGLVPCALVIGSIVPDFEFFLRMTPDRSVSHSLPGIFSFCLPMGLLLLFFFHFILKRPLISLFPRTHQKLLVSAENSCSFFRADKIGLIIVSLFAGIATHLLWDSCTHADGWLAQRIPLMHATLLEIEGIGTVRVYFAAQYLTSFAGIAALLCRYRNWYLHWDNALRAAMTMPPLRLFPISRSNRLRISIGLLVTSGLGGLGYGFAILPSTSAPGSLKLFISHASVAGISFFLSGIVAFAIVWHIISSRK